MKLYPLFFILISTITTAQEQRLRLAFTGDIMAHQDQLDAARRPDGQYDFSGSFTYVQDILRGGDLAIGNLELTFSGGPPYAGYPTFRTPDALASALRKAGFNLLLTANNHANDGGAEGITHTLGVLKQNYFYHTGTYGTPLEKEAAHPLIVYRNGFKLAFLNYTYGLNAPHVKAPALVNFMDEAEMRKDIETARRLQADAIIVALHWGEEYTHIPTGGQRELARRLIEWGADLAIGAHPHVVQPVEWIFDRWGEPKLVAYSLGNFFSGMRLPGTDGGIILEVELVKNERGVSIESCHFIPIWCYPERAADGRRIYRVLPAAPFEEEASALLAIPRWRQNSLEASARRTREILAQSACPERKVSLPATKKEEQYDRFRNSGGEPE